MYCKLLCVYCDLAYGCSRCVPTKNGPQIPKQDIEKIIVLAEERFESSKDKILNNPTVQPIRKLLDTAVDFGKCVKDCFMKRSNHGECFEKHELVHSYAFCMCAYLQMRNALQTRHVCPSLCPHPRSIQPLNWFE